MPYILSIEPTGELAYVHGYHLGTNLRVARRIAERVFHDRNRENRPTTSVSLVLNHTIDSTYDGDWYS